MKLYLITGFLGAGKTTFLKKFIKLFPEKRLHLIINEFGKEGIDGKLLEEMKVEMAEINNGSIFCNCKLDKFEYELEKAIDIKPDIIIVEASGLSDPTNVRRVLSQDKYASIEYMGSICLIDASRFEKVYHTARVVPRQIGISSIALINKVDLASEEQLKNVEIKLKESNPAITIKHTEFGDFKRDWLNYLRADIDIEEAINTQDITLQKALITIEDRMKPEQLIAFLNMISEDTYRIKGFVNLGGEKLFVDGVGTFIKLQPLDKDTSTENKIVVLAGKGVSLRKIIKKASEYYREYIKDVEF